MIDMMIGSVGVRLTIPTPIISVMVEVLLTNMDRFFSASLRLANTSSLETPASLVSESFEVKMGESFSFLDDTVF